MTRYANTMFSRFSVADAENEVLREKYQKIREILGDETLLDREKIDKINKIIK